MVKIQILEAQGIDLQSLTNTLLEKLCYLHALALMCSEGWGFLFPGSILEKTGTASGPCHLSIPVALGKEQVTLSVGYPGLIIKGKEC